MYMHVTSLVGEKEKMEEKEDEFLKSDFKMENVEKELSDREGEHKVQADEQDADECGQLQRRTTSTNPI